MTESLAAQQKLTAASGDAGRRLDLFIAERIPILSRTRIQELIREGNVSVDGRKARASHRVAAGEAVEVAVLPRHAPVAAPEDLPLELLHVDDDFVVVNKPAGMVVHAGAGHARGTLVNALLHRLGKLSGAGGVLRPGIVHRLDRETSGAMVVARNDAAHEHLAEQFKSRNVRKIYLALVHGKMPRDSGTITLPISRDPRRRTRMTARGRTGRHARTDWRVIARLDRCTLVEAVLHTGRTHQIRAHFAVGGSSRSAAEGFASILRTDCGFLGLARRGDRCRSRGVLVIAMTKRALGIGLSIMLFAAAVLRAQQSQPPTQPQASDQANRQGTIVKNVNLVDVLYSVVTKREKLITDLNKEDFKVFDDGVQQEITSFSQPTDLPLRIGMVLDTSNSIRDRLKFEQDAAIDFLFNALRRGKDQAFLMTFDDGPQIIKDFRGDTGDLRDTILKQRAGRGTALYDAVYAASQQLLDKSPLPPGPNPDVRRVLVVISDGDDNSSNRSRGAAVEMAQRAGVIIYSISTSTQWVNVDDERDPA